MLFFSETGLSELRTQFLQSKPYIGQDRYNQLWSMISSIGSDRAITQNDYDHILQLLEPFSRQHGVAGISSLPEREEKSNVVEEPPLEESAEVVFALRFFLLSYAGIEYFEPTAEGHAHMEAHDKGKESRYG